MNQIYFMVPNRKAKGTPIFLDGILHTRFIPREEYKGSTLPPVLTRDSWRIGWMNLTELPEKLYLINKHRLLDFDYCDTSNGFIISEKFKEIIDKHNPMKYLFTPVVMLNRDGEVNSQKSYYFITIQEDVQAIDFDKSKFIEVRPPDIEVGERFPKAKIKEAIKIVLNKKLLGTKPIFYIYQSFFDALLYCNEEFKNSVEAQKIKTIEFHPIEEVVEYLNKTYNLKLSNTEFIIE